MCTSLQIIADLVEDGARANREDVMGVTPLHFAALRGDLEMVKFFLSNGGKVNAVDKLKVLQSGIDPFVITRRWEDI
jgi:ankyrin repeat protein